MTIVPIEGISTLAKQATGSSSSTSATSLPFQSMFEDAINNVKETDATLSDELTKLATGQTDDIHNVTIASSKATLSVQLLVELRDKALDAYNEVMRISV